MALFVVADTHFDDDNAVNYHMRPFDDTNHMNETLVHNWNRVVSYNDTVVVLGDFTGPEVNSMVTAEWASLLNGNKIFVQGDNDKLSITELEDSQIVSEYKIKQAGYDLYCAHNPDDAPDNWSGWVIHGHSHQLHPQDYPLYNYQYKRVNVSVEQIGYTPIAVSAIGEMLNRITHK